VGGRWIGKEREGRGRRTVAEDEEETQDNTKERENGSRKSDSFYDAG
jgi:hypothetical protein